MKKHDDALSDDGMEFNSDYENYDANDVTLDDTTNAAASADTMTNLGYEFLEGLSSDDEAQVTGEQLIKESMILDAQQQQQFDANGNLIGPVFASELLHLTLFGNSERSNDEQTEQPEDNQVQTTSEQQAYTQHNTLGHVIL